MQMQVSTKAGCCRPSLTFFLSFVDVFKDWFPTSTPGICLLGALEGWRENHPVQI